MNVVKWSPLREMENFFDRYYSSFGMPSLFGDEDDLKLRDFEWRPSADISETKTHYVIKAQLPEVDKKDIDVSVEDGVLTLSGERRYEKEEESEEQHRIESMYGRFSRSFALPSDADESHIEAKSKNGVLKIRIPKKEEARPESVKIAVE